MKNGIALITVVCLFSLTAQAGPVAYYQVVTQASGASCADAVNTLVSSAMFTSASANGVPTVQSGVTNYTVASFQEAKALCAQLGATPSPHPHHGSAAALALASAAHRWTQPGATTQDPADSRCNISDSNAGIDYSYLEQHGVCLLPADASNPPADPTQQAGWTNQSYANDAYWSDPNIQH